MDTNPRQKKKASNPPGKEKPTATQSKALGKRLPRPKALPSETDKEIFEAEAEMRRLRDDIATMNSSPNKPGGQKKKGGMLVLGAPISTSVS